MLDAIIGAVIAVVCGTWGYVLCLARPYLDRWVSKKMQKPP